MSTGRGVRSVYGEPPAHAPNAALMIDFDNVTMGIRSDLQNQLRKLLNSEMIKGKVAVQRAYADWRRYPQYIVPLSEASIDLIFAPAFGSNKKNATDIRLAIDALELVFTRPEIGTFILLSGDSDFSSLVLKLKEYGKYIIGVGLRESSSDLLIQNCDEYYSYTELTGLSREGAGPAIRRDPWELVVEAVLRMKQDDDTMRSDRLKQVMQSIDTNFDEKDAGFSRFSKFVVEAAQRGLLSLTKLENGQFAVDVGDNANVPPGDEHAAPAREAPRSHRKRAPRRKAAAAAASEDALTLAEAFDLLKQAVLVLGAVEEDAAVAADDVRAKMIDLLGEESDPIFDRPRFQRMLRQAHDAHLIELVKSDDTGYVLRLSPEATIEDAEGDGAGAAAPADAEGEGPDASPATGRRGGRSRSSTRRAAKGGGGARTPKADAGPAARAETPAPPESEAPAAAPAPQAGAGAPRREDAAGGRRRNPRYRRGSRGRHEPGKPAGAADKSAGPVGQAPAPQPPAAQASAPTREGTESRAAGASGRRSVRHRRSARGGERKPAADAPRAETAPPKGAEPERRPPPEPRGTPVAPPSAAAPAPPPTRPAPREEEKGGLLQRMSAAIRKVVEGPEGG